MNKRRTAAFAAAFLLLFIALTGCAANGNQNNDGKDSEVTTQPNDSSIDNSSATVTDGRDKSDLPAEYNLNGFVLRIYNADYHWDNTRHNLIDATESLAEPLNDKIYERNLKLKQQYNFDIETVSSGSADPMTDMVSKVKSNDDICDVAVSYLDNGLKQATSGCIYDASVVPNINLSKDYWDQNMIDQLSIGGKVFFLSGDIMVSDDDSLTLTMYNTAMASDYDNMEDLYETARNGKWTFAKMIQCMEMVISDVNSDGKINTDEDTIGLLYFKPSMLMQYYAGADESIFIKNGDEITLNDKPDKMQSIFETLSTLLESQGFAYDWNQFGGSESQIAGITSMIQSKRVLFSNMLLSQVRRFYRNITTTFGLLPMPKYQESQDCYSCYGRGQALFIPSNKNGESIEKIGFILEAMGSESYDLTEAYYKVCLASKYTRDEESFEMIRLGTEKIIYDMAYFYNWGGLHSSLNTALHNKISSYTTEMENKGGPALTKMGIFVEALEKAGQ